MREAASRALVPAAVLITLACLAAVPARAADATRTGLKPFNITTRAFDPTRGVASGQDHVSPVDSPDEEHAVASTIAKAASFSKKAEGGRPLPIAFTCVNVEPRR